MDIIPIHKDFIGNYWDQISGFIQMGIDKSMGEMIIEDVMEQLRIGHMQCLVAYDGVEIRAALITEVIQTPRKKILRVVLTGGDDMQDWVHDAVAKVKEGAVAVGADLIDIWGRKGWGKILSCYNPTEAYTVFSIEVQP